MERSCAICKNGFAVTPDEEAFIGKMAFRFGAKTVHPDLPLLCPDCRTQNGRRIVTTIPVQK